MTFSTLQIAFRTKQGGFIQSAIGGGGKNGVVRPTKGRRIKRRAEGGGDRKTAEGSTGNPFKKSNKVKGKKREKKMHSDEGELKKENRDVHHHERHATITFANRIASRTCVLPPQGIVCTPPHTSSIHQIF